MSQAPEQGRLRVGCSASPRLHGQGARPRLAPVLHIRRWASAHLVLLGSPRSPRAMQHTQLCRDQDHLQLPFQPAPPQDLPRSGVRHNAVD